jgi:hypothetical protein
VDDYRGKPAYLASKASAFQVLLQYASASDGSSVMSFAQLILFIYF